MSHIRTGEEVLARCREIKQAEEEGDAVWEAAVAELFAGTPDPVDVIRWKALYDQLEDTLDACEDVANELETITVRQEAEAPIGRWRETGSEADESHWSD